ncbi:MAG: glycoside hydrolase family 32 protein [Thermoguttaceae bacterium]
MMRAIMLLVSLFCLLTGFLAIAKEKEELKTADHLIADFEGPDYANWIVEGKAFGPNPAKGTLPGQMPVSGFEGKGLLNSFFEGDGTTGKMTSPVFVIDRPYLSFLIGGGGVEGLAMNLIVDGKIARTARGPNVKDGGTEQLEWMSWDVTDLQGKEANIEIIDQATGGWGHLNVDQIVLTNQKKTLLEKSRTIQVDKEFVLFPVKKGVPKRWIRVEIDGQPIQEFSVELCPENQRPDFFANLSVDTWRNKNVTFIIEKVSESSNSLDGIVLSDQPVGQIVQDVRFQDDGQIAYGVDVPLYSEWYRPQFHFTPRTGWTNDPNGLVWYNGNWHLFFQHNPWGTEWGNMTWGHAMSPDLLHWTEHPDAIHIDELGTIFSGSGVVDWNNTSGLQEGNEKPILLFYTQDGPSARFGNPVSQSLAYSTDGGKTFKKYAKNPIIPHIVGGNRDPKVIWHEPSKQWILALYMDGEEYALFGSGNARDWTKLCDIKNLGCSECPDFFPLAVDGNPENVKWVFWGGNGKYLIGSFDGKTFTKETEPLTNKYGGNDYAAMTFSDSPDQRRIQLSWMQGGQYPEMPFNQQFTIPRELTLRTTANGVRLFMEPVKEVESLRNQMNEMKDVTLTPGKDLLIPFVSSGYGVKVCGPSRYGVRIIESPLCDNELTIDVSQVDRFSLNIGEQTIRYNARRGRIELDKISAPITVKDGILKLRILYDRTSIELFAQNGEVQIAECFLPKTDGSAQELKQFYKGMTLSTVGGDAKILDAKTWGMNSIWSQK